MAGDFLLFNSVGVLLCGFLFGGVEEPAGHHARQSPGLSWLQALWDRLSKGAANRTATSQVLVQGRKAKGDPLHLYERGTDPG